MFHWLSGKISYVFPSYGGSTFPTPRWALGSWGLSSNLRAEGTFLRDMELEGQRALPQAQEALHGVPSLSGPLEEHECSDPPGDLTWAQGQLATLVPASRQARTRCSRRAPPRLLCGPLNAAAGLGCGSAGRTPAGASRTRPQRDAVLE